MTAETLAKPGKKKTSYRALASRGVTATSDQTMKAIAAAHGAEAIGLVKVLLIEGYALP